MLWTLAYLSSAFKVLPSQEHFLNSHHKDLATYQLPLQAIIIISCMCTPHFIPQQVNEVIKNTFFNMQAWQCDQWIQTPAAAKHFS